MSRVAVVAADDRLRDALVAVADAGTVELESASDGGDERVADALRRLERRGVAARPPALAAAPVEIEELERRGATELLAGEADLSRRAGAAVHRHRAALTVGWMPTEEVGPLAERLIVSGAALVELPRPHGADPPTLLRPLAGSTAFQPIVTTYGTVPYADVDPSVFAAVSYVLMFGMMFGDAGHGLLLVAGGLCLPLTRRPWLRAARRVWPVIVAMGVAAAVGGLLYGEFFGPTAVVPTLWLAPVDNAGRLLLVGVAVGGLLLAVSHVIGTVNRWRESGPVEAMLSATGVAGLLVLAGMTLVAAASAAGSGALAIVAAGIGAVGTTMLATGILGRALGGGAVAVGVVELLDALLRLGTNIISFTRLAAFGIMHAAIGQVVWQGTAALHGGPVGTVAAVLLFTLGNALAFALEALVAGVQALRLEYYELFSRIFAGEGRPFSPWRLPVVPVPAAPEVSP